MTGEATRYTGLSWNFAGHGIVNHGKGEYVSEFDRRVHTNILEARGVGQIIARLGRLGAELLAS